MSTSPTSTVASATEAKRGLSRMTMGNTTTPIAPINCTAPISLVWREELGVSTELAAPHTSSRLIL
eukprot:CAMPEP_0180708594 /NCGR_PEP_ID=MMETSP1038_2-20121128/9320_1 /TAXON_ID=632150 /ORGANISM="Azadinium spinosum, Strain 3D9" /LENGTH=65 /DNA_ID=CAMNT_0022740599 /DNA_START=1004 /DNA_END=1198 /DNA_ORIENTATION=+